MSLRWLFFLGCLSSALAQQEESVFEKAGRAREVARQRAFDRGQRTALPAAEERESIGKMDKPSANAVQSADGKLVHQGPPAAAVYNRVMETARHFKHYDDPSLRNANDTFTDSPKTAEAILKEAHLLYPDLIKPESAFAMRHAVINRWVEARQPPLARDARRVLLIAHMVSLELSGSVQQDNFGLGQIPGLHLLGERPPTFIKRGSFDIEVQGDVAILPEGIRGTVSRGQDGQPDRVQWLDAEGSHSVLIPTEKAGRLVLFGTLVCSYQRIETLKGNYRLRFTP